MTDDREARARKAMDERLSDAQRTVQGDALDRWEKDAAQLIIDLIEDNRATLDRHEFQRGAAYCSCGRAWCPERKVILDRWAPQ